MSTSQSNRFFKIAAGIAAVTLVAWTAMNLGSSDSTDSSTSPGAPSDEGPSKASKPNFEVKPHSAKLGAAGVEPEAEPEEAAEEGGVQQTRGPSRMMLKMATDPVVEPSSARAEVETFVGALLPGVERCWTAEKRKVEAQWSLSIKNSGADEAPTLSGGPVIGEVDHRLEKCLTAEIGNADFPDLNSEFKAHWPFIFNSDGTVEM